METTIQIRDLRNETGLNRREFAEHFGIPLRTVEDWEAGRRKPPEYVPRLLAYQIKMMIIKKESADAKKSRVDKSVDIIKDADGENVVVINDLRFKGRRSVDWNVVEEYLKEYIGEYAEIIETSDVIYIGSDFPDEFCHSKDTKTLKGANLYAKANASKIVKEMIEIASNKNFAQNYNEKHNADARFGWYRYDTRFALPVYNESGELERYNVFAARMLVRHAKDGKLYLYDILRTKKETSRPLEQ